mmetsp:Transcript_7824/g.17053  ORF Transcript_7824/g.17053 Transcript_7824/m.17053 type:complete len:179 (+) Transcript_7824:70-606(+)
MSSSQSSTCKPTRYSSTAVSLRVRFSPRTKVYLVPHLSDMTAKEIAAVYMTDRDTKATQEDLVNTVKAMRSANRVTDCNYCSRGVEQLASAQAINDRQVAKRRVIDAVLDEQDEQYEAGFYNEAKIAEKARNCSQQAVEVAIKRGASDSSFVDSHVREEYMCKHQFAWNEGNMAGTCS